jgi:hypothetical protein
MDAGRNALERTDSRNRRSSPRKTTFKPVVLGYGRRLHASWLRDISASGAFVETEHGWTDITTFAPVQVFLSIGGRSDPDIREYRFSATVARMTDDGVGLRFSDLDMETYSALIGLLAAE